MQRKVAGKKSVEIDRSRTPFVLLGIVVLGGLLTAGAVMWGRSDTGAIDVSATMANSQYVTDNSASGDASVGGATQEYVNMPNGGLLPPGGDTTPAPAPVVVESASTTGTTTGDGTTDTEGVEGNSTEEGNDSTDSIDTAGEATLNTEAEPEKSTSETEPPSEDGQASI